VRSERPWQASLGAGPLREFFYSVMLLRNVARMLHPGASWKCCRWLVLLALVAGSQAWSDAPTLARRNICAGLLVLRGGSGDNPRREWADRPRGRQHDEEIGRKYPAPDWERPETRRDDPQDKPLDAWDATRNAGARRDEGYLDDSTGRPAQSWALRDIFEEQRGGGRERWARRGVQDAGALFEDAGTRDRRQDATRGPDDQHRWGQERRVPRWEDERAYDEQKRPPPSDVGRREERVWDENRGRRESFGTGAPRHAPAHALRHDEARGHNRPYPFPPARSRGGSREGASGTGRERGGAWGLGVDVKRASGVDVRPEHHAPLGDTRMEDEGDLVRDGHNSPERQRPQVSSSRDSVNHTTVAASGGAGGSRQVTGAEAGRLKTAPDNTLDEMDDLFDAAFSQHTKSRQIGNSDLSATLDGAGEVGGGGGVGGGGEGVVTVGNSARIVASAGQEGGDELAAVMKQMEERLVEGDLDGTEAVLIAALKRRPSADVTACYASFLWQFRGDLEVSAFEMCVCVLWRCVYALAVCVCGHSKRGSVAHTLSRGCVHWRSVCAHSRHVCVNCRHVCVCVCLCIAGICVCIAGVSVYIAGICMWLLFGCFWQ